jgi:hypothetical protein
MKNPFQYGGIVEGPAFCNRKKELADIGAAVESSEKALLIFGEAAWKDLSCTHSAPATAKGPLHFSVH